MFLHSDHQLALTLGLTAVATIVALLAWFIFVFWTAVKRCLINVLERIICKKDYEAAVALYLKAAVEEATHPVIVLERCKEAGKGIKAYFKDLWMAFILVVSGSNGYQGKGQGRKSVCSSVATAVEFRVNLTPPPCPKLLPPKREDPGSWNGVPISGNGLPDNDVPALIMVLCGCALLQDALLIASPMTPFSQAATQAATARDGNSTAVMMPTMASCIPGESENWRCAYSHVTFGVFWSVTLGLNCFGMTISMLLLGYMLAVPDSMMHKFADKAAKQGFLGYPATLTLLGTVSFMLSVCYSAFIYYGLVAFIAILAIFVGVTIGAVAGSMTFSFTETSQDLKKGLSMPSDDSAYAPGLWRAAKSNSSRNGPFGAYAADDIETDGSSCQSFNTSLTLQQKAYPYTPQTSGERPPQAPVRTGSNTLRNRAASREV
jgi:hypothetical protein